MKFSMYIIPCYTIVCIDRFGSVFRAVSNELGDTIQITGLRTSSGAPFSFESELYHLREASIGTGIEVHIKPCEVTVSI
jgi:hypothetical protein